MSLHFSLKAVMSSMNAGFNPANENSEVVGEIKFLEEKTYKIVLHTMFCIRIMGHLKVVIILICSENFC